MKVVIDTKMERHMLETTSDDALAVTQSIMEKYEEETPFLTLWEMSKNKTTTLRKSEIMAIFVYPDELHDYDKTTIDMIQDAVIQKEKESEWHRISTQKSHVLRGWTTGRLTSWRGKRRSGRGRLKSGFEI